MEPGRYIADFFTEDGTFVEAWAVTKDLVTREEFEGYCEIYAVILETGKW